MADSHHDLPVVTAPLADLEAADFTPFRANADLPAAMTAHVIYTAVDAERPATVSPKVVGEIIRGHIGFDGLLISDDLSMKALAGTFREKAESLFAAGVDLPLHCNGKLDEMREVAAASPLLEGEPQRRATAAMGRLKGANPGLDPVEAWAEIEAALAIIA
jgi:beta-N-acetylhexosaminidase